MTDLIYDMIDLRSFSNLWYWIMLALFWSSASRKVLGVPFDMIARARRQGEESQAMTDLEALLDINLRRIHYVFQLSGPWILAFWAFLMTMLALFAWVYGTEFAQAVFLLAAPASAVGAMSLRLAQRLAGEPVQGQALCRRLLRHRFAVQLLGMVCVFLTAIFGMYQNMMIGVFG